MKAIVTIVLLAFAAFSTWAMWQVGYFGIWQGAMANPGSWQVLIDLIVACGLICVWMVIDAREHGRNPWPFVAITLTAGSFGPLFYLLSRPIQRPGAG